MVSCNKEVNVLEHANRLKKNSKKRRNWCKDRDKEFEMVQEIPYFMIEMENNQ